MKKRVWGPQKPTIHGQLMYYSEYISSPLWKNHPLRELVMIRDRWCRACGTTEKLEIHHIFYSEIWGEEKLQDLTVFCHKHHRVITNATRKEKYKKRKIKTSDTRRVTPVWQLAVTVQEEEQLTPRDVLRRIPGGNSFTRGDQGNVSYETIQDYRPKSLSYAQRSIGRSA